MVAKAEITSQDAPAAGQQYPYLGRYRHNAEDNPFVVLFTAPDTGVVMITDLRDLEQEIENGAAEDGSDYEDYPLGCYACVWNESEFDAMPAEKGVCIFNAA